MTYAGLIFRSALRSKRRTFLTAASVGVSIFLLIILLTVQREMTTPVETEASARRLIVRHKAGLTNPLPRRYLEKVRRLPDAQVAIPFSWFGGIYIDESKFFPRFAIDPENLFEVYSECTIPPEQLATFKRQRNSCVVGLATAQKYDIDIGERVTIRGDIYPVTLDLEVVGIFERTDVKGIDQDLFFHHAYLDELLGKADEVGTVWVVAKTNDGVQRLAQEIDALFANTEAETKTQSEKQFALDFVAMIGNIKILIGSISTVVVLTLFVVVASTIAMTIRERKREIAVFKTFGMQRGLIFTLLVGEAVGIAAAGGVAGLLLAQGLFGNLDIAKLSGGFLFKFEMTPANQALCFFVALLIGFGSAIVPAWSASRQTVLGGLRAIE